MARVLPGVVHPKKVAAARAGLPHDSVVRDAVEVFKALANPIRLSIMHALSHEEMSVGDLAWSLDLTLPTVSHQLAILRRMKLIASRDEGRFTFYRASDRAVGHLVHDCIEHAENDLGRPSRAHHHPHRDSRRRSR